MLRRTRCAELRDRAKRRRQAGLPVDGGDEAAEAITGIGVACWGLVVGFVAFILSMSGSITVGLPFPFGIGLVVGYFACRFAVSPLGLFLVKWFAIGYAVLLVLTIIWHTR